MTCFYINIFYTQLTYLYLNDQAALKGKKAVVQIKTAVDKLTCDCNHKRFLFYTDTFLLFNYKNNLLDNLPRLGIRASEWTNHN